MVNHAIIDPDEIDNYNGNIDALPTHLLNRVNKELTNQIAHYEGEEERIGKEVNDHKSRLSFMAEHLSNVKAEIINTQQLHSSKRVEVESEDHLAQLAERERGRLLQRVQELQTQEQEWRDRCDIIQNRIFQGTLRMDEFKAATNFNQDELEQWDIARRQKEDDEAVLNKYTKIDDKKLKALTLKVEKTLKNVQHKREDLEKEVTETRAAQIELDKTAVDYKELHQQQADLLRQWEDAVKAMHGRDRAIESAEHRFIEGKLWLEKRQQQLKSRIEFQQVEFANCRETEEKIQQQDRVLAKYREDHGKLKKQLDALHEEIETVRNTYSKLCKDSSDIQSQMQGLTEQKRRAIDTHNATAERHQRTLERLEQSQLDAADLVKQSRLVDELVQETERSMKGLDKESSRIKNEQYVSSEALFEARRKQASYLAEVSGAQAQGKNMAAKIRKLDGESFKQQELLYTIEFNIQQMERKVNRAKGERTEEEKRDLQEQIDTLQKMYDDLLKQHKVLDVQVTRVQDDLRHAKKSVVILEKNKKHVSNALLELTLENESCQTELQKMTKDKENSLVHSDVLQLQVEGLRRTLKRRGKEMLGLENRQQQLQLTIQEREMEIKVHHDELRAEEKVAEEERRVSQVELTERLKLLEHLKSRYEVHIGRLGHELGESTQAQNVVNAAREKEEKQAKGDALDAAIKKMERESYKLDKAIAVLQGSNAKYKHNFTKVQEGDDEMIESKMLMKKKKTLQGLMNKRSAEVKAYMQSEMSAVGDMQERIRQKEEEMSRIAAVRDREAALRRDCEAERELVARYDVAVGKASKLVAPGTAQDIILVEENDKISSLIAALQQLCTDRSYEVSHREDEDDDGFRHEDADGRAHSWKSETPPAALVRLLGQHVEVRVDSRGEEANMSPFDVAAGNEEVMADVDDDHSGRTNESDGEEESRSPPNVTSPLDSDHETHDDNNPAADQPPQ